MCEALVFPLELQNHLLQATHWSQLAVDWHGQLTLTTLCGL